MQRFVDKARDKAVEILCFCIVGTGMTLFGLCACVGAYLAGLIGFVVGAIIGFSALVVAIQAAAAVCESCEK